MALQSGLYVVATPIGNLGDITARAIDTLAKVDVIAAEDTRHTGRLLQHLAISKPMISLHEHNEREKSELLVGRIASGQSVALVSDAGTPLISDPGYHLVSAVREAGFLVSPVPGACAVVAALSASGLPSDKFVFEGFLPSRSAARRAYLGTLISEPRTLVFYESPHRIVESIEDLAFIFGGERQMVIGRELTKAFETMLCGTILQVKERVCADDNQQKGEFVILLRGAVPAVAQESVTPECDRLLRALLKEVPIKLASKIAADVTGIGKNQLYERALVLQGKRD